MAYIYMYMLLSSFAAPQNGSRAFICGPPSVHLRPPLFETTVFVARNGFFLRFPEIKFPHCFRIFRVFHKCHFGGRFWRFLRSGKILFFSRVSGLGSSRRSPRGRRTRNTSKQGVSEHFCVVVPRSLALDPLYRLDAAQIFENHFWGSHKFVFFGSSNF